MSRNRLNASAEAAAAWTPCASVRLALQAIVGATGTKSHALAARREVPAAQVQISLLVPGVTRNVWPALLGSCLGAGQKALEITAKADRVALRGSKSVPDVGRRAVRGGTTASQVVRGGQRIAVRRLRARSTSQGELALPGVSKRRYASTRTPVPATYRPRAASKSAVSRRFVQLSREPLARGSRGPSASWTCRW